jgi:hypothetical protein
MGNKMTDEKFIKATRKAREESVRFFSSAGKTERELWVATEFLTNLGIAFAAHEVVASKSDPPDVLFRSAEFEIKEILDKGRRRHQEFKDSLKSAMEATSVAELFEQYTPRDISYVEVYALILEQATELASIKYPLAVRETLDLLFYVNLDEVHGFIEQPIPSTSELILQGWRSVSFIIGRASCIVVAQTYAPAFLLPYLGRVTTRDRGRDKTLSNYSFKGDKTALRFRPLNSGVKP